MQLFMVLTTSSESRCSETNRNWRRTGRSRRGRPALPRRRVCGRSAGWTHRSCRPRRRTAGCGTTRLPATPRHSSPASSPWSTRRRRRTRTTRSSTGRRTRTGCYTRSPFPPIPCCSRQKWTPADLPTSRRRAPSSGRVEPDLAFSLHATFPGSNKDSLGRLLCQTIDSDKRRRIAEKKKRKQESIEH